MKRECFMCAASVSEKKGAMQLLRYIKLVPCVYELCKDIKLVWVDGGYRGEGLADYVQKLWGWIWQVVLRTDKEKGFKILPRRWVVERTGPATRAASAPCLDLKCTKIKQRL